MIYAVIMAGGLGTRFWPKSRFSRPKQFLKLINHRTLLQNTYDRITGYIPPEQIIVITNQSYVSLVEEQLPDIPSDNIIGEPQPRNTAPCIAFTASIVSEKDPDATMVVLPADHYINDNKEFINTIKSGVAKVQKSEKLLTIGIEPNRPETGYGYIQFNDSDYELIEGKQIHQVKTFAEKPDLDTAANFLESGDFLWNSGMFIWKCSSILKQIKEHLPEVYNECERLREYIKSDTFNAAIEEFYQNCPSISIDYGIMEKTSEVFVILAKFGWSDVGSWMAVYELQEKDPHGNVVESNNCQLIDTENSYISTNSGKLVTVIGMQGAALIETDDAILLCRLDTSQDVKKMVEKLGDSKLSKYL